MKSILKRLVPIIFLKQLFLIYNALKRKSIDLIIFGTYQPTETELKVQEEKNPFLASGIDVRNLKPRIQEGLLRWQNPNWKQNQYICEICDRDVFLESQTGWGVTDGTKLIYASLGFSSATYVHKPSIRQVLFKKRKEVFLQKVISLRDTGEENYFHFYNDILAKLLFLRDHSLLDFNAYIVVGERLWAKSYFQTFIDQTWLNQLKWYVQKDEWVHTRHVIFCKPYTHTKKYLTELVSLLPPVSGAVTPSKILITRSQSSLRFIENEDEIFSILLRYGFKKVDAAELTLREQVNLFANATDVVAVHGAGIANIIFRNGKPLRLLEIFHRNSYLPFHYIMLAHLFGYGYQALRGTKGVKSGKGGFYVEPLEISEYCQWVETH